MAKWAWSSRRGGHTAAELFLNHSLVPWSMLTFNEWLWINHKWCRINTAAVHMTFSFEPTGGKKKTFHLKIVKLYFFFFSAYYLCPHPLVPMLLFCRPIPWAISIKWSCRVFSLTFPSLSLGSWLVAKRDFVFFRKAISNLIEVHFCPLVLWIKMGFFKVHAAMVEHPFIQAPSTLKVNSLVPIWTL